MKLCQAALHPYRLRLKTRGMREGTLIELADQSGNIGWGDISPLPQRNLEKLTDAIQQFNAMKAELLSKEWNTRDCLQSLKEYALCSSLHFGWESALLNLLSPIQDDCVEVSALLMGSPSEILEQAKLRKAEGFKVAKLKVSNLSFEEAGTLIHQLKEDFRLRVDVNQAWTTGESLRFFSQFSPEELDYVEDPFQNPLELSQFTHPLAIEESFLQTLSLEQIEKLPALKALVFKPTSQGGLEGYLSLLPWAQARNVALILSSNFESDVGLACIGALACRLPLSCRHAIGIGTYHHMEEYLSNPPLQFANGKLIIKREK